jgi:hypothetical protein
MRSHTLQGSGPLKQHTPWAQLRLPAGLHTDEGRGGVAGPGFCSEGRLHVGTVHTERGRCLNSAAEFAQTEKADPGGPWIPNPR